MLYSKTVESTAPLSCAHGNCHGPNVDKRNIQIAASNPGAIDAALGGIDGNAEVVALDLRNPLPLSASDLEYLADWIFYGLNGGSWMFEPRCFPIPFPTFEGVWPANTIPVYIFYNNGLSGAPNDRYTTDLGVRATMLALGWIPEGAGPIG